MDKRIRDLRLACARSHREALHTPEFEFRRSEEARQKVELEQWIQLCDTADIAGLRFAAKFLRGAIDAAATGSGTRERRYVAERSPYLRYAEGVALIRFGVDLTQEGAPSQNEGGVRA